MPWRVTGSMDEKRAFIRAWARRDRSISALCREFGVSRPTGHKWIDRFAEEGLAGLEERSRAPHSKPTKTPEAIAKQLVEFRRELPWVGSRKLIAMLKEEQPEIKWPAASTGDGILKNAGLVTDRHSRRRTPPYCMQVTPPAEPNDVWAADYKGWFTTRDGKRIDPLTITDERSRFIIACKGYRSIDGEAAKKEFERAFRTHGLPRAIRTDNGSPFATPGPGALSKLSVWWIRLGIMPERIRPSHPEDNPRHERMHRTLKAATARQPRATLCEQQEAFDEFVRLYNEKLPHESLGMKPPASIYRASPREMPKRLPEVQYGPDYQIRKVRHNGEIKFRGYAFYVSHLLAGQPVGLRSTEAGLDVCFGPIPLGSFNESKGSFIRL